MNQQKLEEKVREIFEQQEFNVREEQDVFVAENEERLVLNIFSSEDFTEEEIVESVSEGKIFVDEGLAKVEEKVDMPVSVIHEDRDKEEYDLPSYELIGEIAVINELTVDECEAVEGILDHHPSVKTILLKEEPLQGEYRVGEYRKLYGEETETVHREYGCRLKVDPTKVYYSERFSTERKRVVNQIQDGEKVLVMFAGVGPFAIMAAKLANPEKVVAVEKNPEAAKYLQENIELNNLGDVVEGYEGDVEGVLPELDDTFDRIIMPLPGSSHEFVDLAISCLNSSGIIHFYTFLEDKEESAEIVDSLIERDFEISETVKCGVRSPAESRYCIDISL